MDSFPLVPKDDDSLLLINAGMAPLKKYFTRAAIPPSNRVTTCQKCIRTGDIDSVGKTARHCTFFEMLGNFSFGDYFKKDAISYAWEFLTKVIEIPEDRLYVSVFNEDNEAYDLWKERISEDRLFKIGKEENFWEIGVGPCGPCSEIFYAFTGEKVDSIEKFLELQEKGEIFEIWNLVFTQFNKNEDGTYESLEYKNIDTGMGLERLAIVTQNVRQVFDTDIFTSIIEGIKKISDKSYEEFNYSYKVIADHARSITFLICDGVTPSNEGRGYVLRRLIRRSVRHGKLLNINEKFLNSIVDIVVNEYKSHYKELVERRSYIGNIISLEEDNFNRTLNKGIDILSSYIDDLNKNNEKVLSGSKTFKLYDTYGFPVELTEEILKEKGFTADIEGFKEEMKIQQEKARSSRKTDNYLGNDLGALNVTENYHTEFIGYYCSSVCCKARDIISENKFVESVSQGNRAFLLSETTPFYPEMGGQIGDTGTIKSKNGEAKVLGTKKNMQGQIYHIIEVTSGTISKNDDLHFSIDEDRRRSICRNHTATHLLQSALKKVLGDHVKQSGSYLDDKKLRFDFTHFKALTSEEMIEVEKIVNECIYKQINVNTEIMNIKDAQKKGATALFDEKYEDEVRVLSISDVSMELCGGTHVENTGFIGSFVISSESSVSSGVRRIEALTGSNVYESIKENRKLMGEVSSLVKANSSGEVLNRIKTLTQDIKNKYSEILSLKSKIADAKLKIVDNVIMNAPVKNGIRVVCNLVEDIDVNRLRNVCSDVRDKVDCGVVMFASLIDGKASVVCMANKKAVDLGVDCGKLIREVLKYANGSGGGRKDMAQGSATDLDKIQYAFEKLYEII